MDSLKDLMQQRANELDVDAKRNEIEIAQQVITRHVKKGARVTKLTENKSLIVEVNSSALASEIRFMSPMLKKEINGIFTKTEITYIRTRVR